MNKKLSNNSNCDSVVIIGMACRFPGANNYHDFWDNLHNGVNAIQEIPSDRWNINDYYSDNFWEANKSISKWGGFLDNIKRFDHKFFRILPEEACNMDPQHRIGLELAWHCMEDAAVKVSHLQKHKTSVFAGISSVNYLQIITNSNQISPYACIGNYSCGFANRISYAFNVHGESISINSACASSLVAIEYAKKSLRNGKSDYAIVLGSNIICHPWEYVALSKAGLLSPDGQCKTFDVNANGYVRSEGIGVLLLTTLRVAKKFNHHIHAVLNGSAVNHCGSQHTISTPSVTAQQQVILEAQKDSKILPTDLNYIETHGTGTVLGDIVELQALGKVFGDRVIPLPIGSVKTNIGHLETAAGMAGLLKAILMLRNKEIPLHLNLKTPNDMLIEHKNCLIVPSKLEKLDNLQNGKYFIGISSFGFTGSNAHVVISNYTKSKKIFNLPTKLFPLPFILSAKSKSGLIALIERWKFFIENSKLDKTNIFGVCYTMLNGREVFEYRLVFLAKNKLDIIQGLNIAPKSVHLNDKVAFAIEFPSNNCNFDLSNNKHLIKYALTDSELAFYTKAISNYTNLDFIHKFFWGCIIVRCLYNFGIVPHLMFGTGIGNVLTFYLSGMINLSQAITAISNNNKIPDNFNIPQNLVFDTNSKSYMFPCVINDQYVGNLRCDIAKFDVSEEVLLNRAHNLYEKFPYFRKLLVQWGQKFFVSIKKFDDIYSEPNNLIQKLILYIVIELYYRKLYKQDILCGIKFKNLALKEVANLLLYNIITTTDARKIVFNDEVDLDSDHNIKLKIERYFKYSKPDPALAILNKHCLKKLSINDNNRNAHIYSWENDIKDYEIINISDFANDYRLRLTQICCNFW